MNKQIAVAVLVLCVAGCAYVGFWTVERYNPASGKIEPIHYTGHFSGVSERTTTSDVAFTVEADISKWLSPVTFSYTVSPPRWVGPLDKMARADVKLTMINQSEQPATIALDHCTIWDDDVLPYPGQPLRYPHAMFQLDPTATKTVVFRQVVISREADELVLQCELTRGSQTRTVAVTAQRAQAAKH